MPRKRLQPPDGRANNGGARQGTTGTQYANRSDLRQTPTAATGQEYGKAGAQIAAQRAVPLAAAPPVGPPPAGPPVAAGFATPEDTPNLTDPTRRPDEPVTAGMPFGPGPGPDPRSAPMSDVEARLRALYAAYPTRELRELINQIDQGG